MPIESLWAFVIALIILALGLSLKLAGALHSNKLLNKELDSLIKQIAALQKEHENIVSSPSELGETSAQELVEKYEKQIDNLLQKVAKLENPSHGRMLKQLEQEIDFFENQ